MLFRKWLVTSGVFSFLVSGVLAADSAALPEGSFESPPPLEPVAALKSFRLQNGFSLELVAAEPLLVDPVDVAYDEQGRAYVVEMRGYPLPEKADQARPEPVSRIRMLWDDNHDGTFDRSTVFMDRLEWPTSVCVYRDGVYIADAPDIWYAKDTDGDGVADERRKVLTGFKRENVQALMNSLRVGIDHQVYGAASGSGGMIQVVSHPEKPAVSVNRRDFRFDPQTDIIESISGGARFGASFDDWGNRFLCNIRNPVQHVVLPLQPLLRNPSLTIPSLLHDVAAAGETLPVFRISPVEAWREFRARRWVQERVNYPRSELVGAGFFTSSSGITIYRGDAYPSGMYGEAFVADVAANIVHRERLVPDGVTFRGERLDEGAEFVASTDVWFRPVNFVNAPDGTLHIVDMYRLNIEHPWSIPDDIRSKIDLTAGNDRGRIWRLVPPGYKRPASLTLAKATTAELVQELTSRNSWRRETAHRLLWEQQDAAAVPLLRQLLQTTSEPLGRLHAAWSLQGLGQLQWEDVAILYRDPHAGVREQGIGLAEVFFSQEPAWLPILISAAQDKEPRVRLAAAFALGNHAEPAAMEALASIARTDCADPWMRLAVTSLPATSAPHLLKALLQRPEFADVRGAATLFQDLGRLVGLADRDQSPQEWLTGTQLPVGWEFALWAGWLDSQTAATRASKKTAAILQGDAWKGLQGRARTVAADSAQPLPMRLQAVALLKHSAPDDVQEIFLQLLAPREPRELQITSIRAIALAGTPAVARLLVDRYRMVSPAVRAEIVDLLAARPAWHPLLLGAIEQGEIRPADVPVNRRALLLRQTNPELLAQAERFFGAGATSSRQAALDAHAKTLDLSSSPQRGLTVFQRECAQCHRSQGIGYDIGPPLASIRNRSPQELLVHVLDPNREVGPNYVDFVATLSDGRSLTGLLANETETQLTLLRPQGVQDVIERKDVDELVSTGKSLMPEGLEQRMTAQELADVIDYLLHPDGVTLPKLP